MNSRFADFSMRQNWLLGFACLFYYARLALPPPQASCLAELLLLILLLFDFERSPVSCHVSFVLDVAANTDDLLASATEMAPYMETHSCHLVAGEAKSDASSSNTLCTLIWVE